jgi:hypothetical protein
MAYAAILPLGGMQPQSLLWWRSPRPPPVVLTWNKAVTAQ